MELKQADPVQLRQLLDEHFNKSELEDLCFELNIAYENLAGETKRDKARELVTYCVRYQRIAELLAACRRLRPKVSWPDDIVTAENEAKETQSPLSPPSSPPNIGGVQIGGNVQVSGDLVGGHKITVDDDTQ